MRPLVEHLCPAGCGVRTRLLGGTGSAHHPLTQGRTFQSEVAGAHGKEVRLQTSGGGTAGHEQPAGIYYEQTVPHKLGLPG